MPPPDSGNYPTPSNEVLAERIRGLTAVVADLSLRMDGLATERTLVDLLGSRDREFTAKVEGVAHDLRDLVAALAAERGERISEDKANEERVNRSRALALTGIGLGVTFLFGILTVILSVRGGV